MNAINYITRAGTKFPSTRRVIDETTRVLKPGSNNRKLGAWVSKGAWIGMPIYSLTLEERATCPRSCENYDRCYGNNMPFAHRFEQGPALEAQLDIELAVLQLFHPEGFVVRLHVLGDFYSPDYVRLWQSWLVQHQGLRVYGYTAWLPDTAIGAAIRDAKSPRFKVRTSGIDTRTVDDFSTNDVGIQCPVQLTQSKSCGTCTLCWSTDQVITFKAH